MSYLDGSFEHIPKVAATKRYFRCQTLCRSVERQSRKWWTAVSRACSRLPGIVENHEG